MTGKISRAYTARHTNRTWRNKHRHSVFNEMKATATQPMVGNPKTVHGVTKFSDWSSVEFKGKLLTFRASTEEQKTERECDTVD